MRFGSLDFFPVIAPQQPADFSGRAWGGSLITGSGSGSGSRCCGARVGKPSINFCDSASLENSSLASASSSSCPNNPQSPRCVNLICTRAPRIAIIGDTHVDMVRGRNGRHLDEVQLEWIVVGSVVSVVPDVRHAPHEEICPDSGGLQEDQHLLNATWVVLWQVVVIADDEEAKQHAEHGCCDSETHVVVLKVRDEDPIE